jgi:hypothetical protein
MTTIKQLERNWTSRQYDRLYRDLVACRPEAGLAMEFDGNGSTPAAAMALIRMDELSQAHVPLYGQLLRTVLAAQLLDGSWGDPATTAVCLRSLLCGHGNGAAIERGMAFLANLQKPEGLWPRFPLRRLPEDAEVSAFILYQLGDQPVFQAAVRLDDAIAWFESNGAFLDEPVRELWRRAQCRCHAPAREMAISWS